MKTRTRKDSLKNLTKLSTSRTTSRTHSFGNSANSLFGPRKNVLVTYSKSKPINILRKHHFHSPDTPHVSTPDSLQTTGKDQESNLEDKSKGLKSQGKGSSYTLQKTQLSLKDSNFKTSTPGIGTTAKPTLALRNISNIPIDKTLSRTQCTPRRESQTVQPPSEKQVKAKRKLTPFNGKSKARFPKNNGRRKLQIASLKLDENDEASKSRFSTTKNKETVASLIENEEYLQEEMCQNNSTLKPQSQSQKAKLSVQQDSTNYSVKSMSTDSDVRARSDHCQINTLTAQSMSFCTMVEVKGDSTQATDKNLLQENYSTTQYNSTFNEDFEQIHIEDYFKELLSPIKEDDKQNEQTEEKVTGASHAAVIPEDPDNTKQNMICTDAPRTSTPIDEGKANTAPIDEPGISPITKEYHNELSTKPEEIQQGKDISNKETSRCKSIHMKKKHDKNKDINKETSRNTSKSISTKTSKSVSPKTKKKHKDSSKNTSLPLQASICIEDDSDNESIPDNITPEVMPYIKSQCSSSKRKLEYTADMPFKPNTKQCILQDFPCTVTKSCNYKVWIKMPAHKNHNNFSAMKNNTFPMDILRNAYH